MPSIESVESPAIERGTNDQLKIVGANLANAREVVFYQRGVACQAIEVINNEELSLQLTTQVDCPTGMHAFRLRTDDGFSELRTFAVTPYPVVRAADEKSKLTLKSSVIGDLNDGEMDRYAIALTSNQRLAIDVEAIRLGTDLVDVAVTVRAPDGHIVAQADDSNLYRQDPVLSFVAEQTGEYIVQVADAGRSSVQNSTYILHLSDGPRPLAVFPLGGQPGTSIELTFYGDCLGKWKVQPELPDLKPNQTDKFQLFAVQGDQRSATPLPFRLSRLPNIIESAGNDDWQSSNSTGSSASASEVPAALNGIIEQPLDRDCFWMRGVPGQLLDVDVFAQRLGSAADTKLTVVDSAQSILAESDDVDSLDSRVEFVVPDDGKFGIAIEEKRGKGGDTFGYRVEVTPVRPTVDVYLPRRERMTQDLQTVAVPVGNRVLALMAVRKDDKTGETNLRFPELPTGTTAHFTQPRADQAIVPVVFEAAADAKLAGQLISVEVSVHSPAATAVGEFRQVTDLVRGPADAIYTEHQTNRLALCTRVAYPVSVTVDQPRATLVQDGTLDLVVHLQRQEGFNGDVSLTLPWLPGWIDAEPRVIVPADQTQAVFRLRAWKQAEVAHWPIVIEASAENASRRRSRGGSSGAGAGATAGIMLGGNTPPPTGLSLHAVASLPIELNVTKPPATGHFDSAAAEQGEEVEVVCELLADPELHKVQNLVATLEGLPNRVECQPVSINTESTAIRFRVQLQPTAPLGRYVGLACRLSGMFGGESVSYVISRDGELTIEQPGQIVRDESGRPLNRVEALRKKTTQGKPQSNVR